MYIKDIIDGKLLKEKEVGMSRLYCTVLLKAVSAYDIKIMQLYYY